MDFYINRHNKSITAKIIITSLLACAAIFLSLYISRVTSARILSTVQQLSKPNAKIQLVNRLFRDIVILDQLQRTQALKTQPRHYTPFLKESNHIQGLLDSLRTMSLQSNTQVRRIDSMKKILYRRDYLFLKYVSMRTALLKNDTLNRQARNLSELIEKVRSRMDSNTVTTSKATRTVIDTLREEEEQQSLWNRIFSKRKTKTTQVQKQIEEELNVRTDTLALGSRGDSLAGIGRAISEMEINRTIRRNQLMKRQTELNRAGEMLIAQLMNILHDIETDELGHATQQNAMANEVVNSGIVNIGMVLIIFILGTAVLIFFIFTDIYRSNQNRRELIAAKVEAEEAGQVKQRFLANMSHELRTPLQTIIGISEQIRMVSQPPQQDLENIHQSSLHLLQIVNEVLDYSRIISGKFLLEDKPFNMHRVLDEVKEMIQVQLALKHLHLHCDISIPEDSYYSGDPFRLKQILLNLLGNAVKFTDKGSVSLSVKEEALQDNTTMFTFIVKDTGVGIAAADLAIIFNQFEQGSNLHQQQGTGLGLSIVKALVDLLQGTIQADSEPGEGTTFTLSIPYEKANAIAEEAAAPQMPGTYKEHVWVVDDDLFILQLCDSILNKHSIPHTCFSSAQEVLQTPFPPDLGIVFLDIRMGEMDGITLCHHLKERPSISTPVYIALTAQALPDEREAILQKGFDGLVMKPFLEQDFINAIYKQGAGTPHNLQPSVDLSAIYTMADGDEGLVKSVLQSFVSETEKDMMAIRHSIAANDAYQLAEAFHRLAGRCGQLGAATLAYKLRTMEIALREDPGTIHKVAVDMETVYKEITAMMKAING